MLSWLKTSMPQSMVKSFARQARRVVLAGPQILRSSKKQKKGGGGRGANSSALFRSLSFLSFVVKSISVCLSVEALLSTRGRADGLRSVRSRGRGSKGYGRERKEQRQFDLRIVEPLLLHSLSLRSSCRLSLFLSLTGVFGCGSVCSSALLSLSLCHRVQVLSVPKKLFFIEVQVHSKKNLSVFLFFHDLRQIQRTVRKNLRTPSVMACRGFVFCCFYQSSKKPRKKTLAPLPLDVRTQRELRTLRSCSDPLLFARGVSCSIECKPPVTSSSPSTQPAVALPAAYLPLPLYSIHLLSVSRPTAVSVSTIRPVFAYLSLVTADSSPSRRSSEVA